MTETETETEQTETEFTETETENYVRRTIQSDSSSRGIPQVVKEPTRHPGSAPGDRPLDSLQPRLKKKFPRVVGLCRPQGVLWLNLLTELHNMYN